MGALANCDTRSTAFFGIRREVPCWRVRVAGCEDVSLLASNAREAGEIALSWWNTPSLAVENCEAVEYGGPEGEPYNEGDILSVQFEGTLVR